MCAIRWNWIWRVGGIALIFPALSGCSTYLYMQGDPTPACNEPPRDGTADTCRYTRTSNVHANPNYLTATEKHALIPYGVGSGMLFDLTPLGFIAPVFGYPHKEVTYDGFVHLRSVATDFKSKDYPFEAKPRTPTHLRIDFNEKFQENLHRMGKAAKYSPGSVVITINCKSDACSATADPAIVDPSGIVSLKAEHVKDAQRIRDIAEETRLEKARAREAAAAEEARVNQAVAEKEAQEREETRANQPKQDAVDVVIAMLSRYGRKERLSKAEVDKALANFFHERYPLVRRQPANVQHPSRSLALQWGVDEAKMPKVEEKLLAVTFGGMQTETRTHAGSYPGVRLVDSVQSQLVGMTFAVNLETKRVIGKDDLAEEFMRYVRAW